MAKWIIVLALLMPAAAWAQGYRTEPGNLTPLMSGVGDCSPNVVQKLNNQSKPTCISGAIAAGPTNTLPLQTGTYNENHFRTANLAAPIATGDALSEGHAIGAITPAAITATAVNGVVNFLAQPSALCDSATAQDTILDNAISAAEAIGGTGLGILQIPASCNGTTGHSLYIVSSHAIPAHVCIEALGGPPWPGDINATTVTYQGTGVPFTSTNTNGACLKNIRVVNTGTGTIGLDLIGASKFDFSGSGFEGFATGIEQETSSASSAIRNHAVGAYAYLSTGA